jgi:hypothetical protein
VSGASSSRVAAAVSTAAACHVMAIVAPMVASEKASATAALANMVAENIITSLPKTVAFAIETKMRLIQERVMELIETNEEKVVCNLISVDLPHSSILLKEQVKFEGGKAVIKPESFNLMKQLSICKKSISQTCKEFNIDNMSWRVEGHTAVSKKSTDGGMATSMDRARAGRYSCQALTRFRKL